MSNQEAKKAKRRKSRVQTGKPSLSSISQMKQSEASFEESGDAEVNNYISTLNYESFTMYNHS